MEMDGQLTFEFSKRPTIKGFPELRWTGKRPYESTQYYPAQLKERYGEDVSGWINRWDFIWKKHSYFMVFRKGDCCFRCRSYCETTSEARKSVTV